MNQHFVQVQPLAPQPPTVTTTTPRAFRTGNSMGKSETHTPGELSGYDPVRAVPNTGFVYSVPGTPLFPPAYPPYIPPPPRGRWVWIPDYSDPGYYPPPTPGRPVSPPVYCGELDVVTVSYTDGAEITIH